VTFRIGDAVRLSGVRRWPCWRKERWASEGAAAAQKRSLLRNEKVTEADKVLLNVYRCPHCGRWHVGRTAKKEE
jgi:hypothetical protein